MTDQEQLQGENIPPWHERLLELAHECEWCGEELSGNPFAIVVTDGGEWQGYCNISHRDRHRGKPIMSVTYD